MYKKYVTFFYLTFTKSSSTCFNKLFETNYLLRRNN